LYLYIIPMRIKSSVLLSTINPSKTKIHWPDVGTVEIRFTGFDFPNVETCRATFTVVIMRYLYIPHKHTLEYICVIIIIIICNVYAFVAVLQYIIITLSSCTPSAHANYTTAINTFQLLRDHISPESPARLCNRSIYLCTNLFIIGIVVIDVLLSFFFFFSLIFRPIPTYFSQLSANIWMCT